MKNANDLQNFYCVIPAGGAGTRLWPLSRADVPKFLLDLAGTGSSLLTSTWNRLTPLVPPERILVVTGQAHKESVQTQLPDLHLGNLITESEPKDSSAAIGLAAAILERRDPDAVIGSFAADHVINNSLLFERAVSTAVKAAKHDYIVTIGIRPTFASTGFGYIKSGDARDDLAPFDIYNVTDFVEKPNSETANSYFEHGGYLWNAGMFISKASLLLDQMSTSEPEMVNKLRQIANSWDKPDAALTREELWPSLPKIAIDYTVAEPAAKAGKMVCVAAHFDWDDVGDFASVANLLTRGREHDLAVLGSKAQVLSDKSSGLIVSDSKALIAVVGVEDIVVVDTEDVLLVTTKNKAQEVKKLVDHMRLSGGKHLL